MTDLIVFSNIEFQPKFENVSKRVHVRSGTPDALELQNMLDEAVKIAKPVGCYRSARVERREQENVVISGIEFQSRILRVNLNKAEVVFPFVASCGMELQDWGEKETDMLRSFWAESIKEEALLCSLKHLQKEIVLREKTGHFSTMSPGSLESWPISQQAPLFELLGMPVDQPMVRLTDSMLMIPTKSVSGIIFPTDETFESCMLCQREDCPNRRAPYDETLYEREYCPATL